MSNLGLLLNTNIINEFGINKIKNSNTNEKKKILGYILLMVVAFGTLGYYMFDLCFMMSDYLLQVNQMELLLIIGFVGSIAFSLFTSIYKGSTYLFNAKDFDMLISLPIRESTILASKVIMLLLTNYFFSIPLIFIPGVVYFIKVETSLLFIPYLAIMFLVVPLIPIIVASIISFLLGSVSSKIKHKNIVLIGGSIFLLIGYMALVTQIEPIASKLLSNSSSIIETIGKLYLPAYYYVDVLKNNNFISLLLFMAISIVPFVAFVSIFSKQFKIINSRMNENYKSKEYKLTDLKTSNIITSLIRKEFSRYFSSYIYVLNTSIGVILLPICSLALVIFGAEKLDALLNLNIDMNMLKPQIIIAVLFMVIMSCTTHCSISLEGKNLWIIKSLPIKETDIFKAKIFMNLILIVPISILSFIAIALKLKFDFVFILIMIATIIAIGILTAVGGILANLLFPNLDWKNEVAVVKRSASVMIVLFGEMIYLAIFGGIFYLLNVSMNNINLFLAISTIVTFIISIILWNIVKTKGVKIFRNL